MKIIFDLTKHIVSKNPYLRIISEPEIYLKKMILSTLFMGAAVFTINYIYIHTPMHSVKIPNGIHSMLGFVIAMLLVFRTNTAYDRWWEGRKKVQELQFSYNMLGILLKTAMMRPVNNIDALNIRRLYDHMHVELLNIRSFLKGDMHTQKFFAFHTNGMTDILNILHDTKKSELFTNEEFIDFRKYVTSIYDILVSCDRIKSTPIPFAYAIHIKVCVFVYIVTLPFSMFYDLNLWSTPVVMALYFIISGTELISEEIENPFQNQANDLPIDVLMENIKDQLKNYRIVQ